MKTMSYCPGPLREVLIPKQGGSGKLRPLGISNLEDKLVQIAVARVLEAIYEPIFLECSFGFRPNRSCHMAIRGMSDYLYSNFIESVIDLDLENYFGTIDHKQLIRFLEMRIKDKIFIRYIIRMLKAGVMSDGELRKADDGSPHGSIVSPILSNIYAHYVIDEWFQSIVKKHARSSVELFRYCDDIIVCCKYQSDSDRILKALDSRLQKYGLRLNRSKTSQIPFSKWHYSQGREQGVFDLLGFTFYMAQGRNGGGHIWLKTSRKRLKAKLRVVKEWVKTHRHKGKIKDLWLKFGVKLAGRIRYYGVSFNERSVSNFCHEAIRILFKWMNRRSGRRSSNWNKFLMMMKKYPPPKIKVFHSLLVTNLR